MDGISVLLFLLIRQNSCGICLNLCSEHPNSFETHSTRAASTQTRAGTRSTRAASTQTRARTHLTRATNTQTHARTHTTRAQSTQTRATRTQTRAASTRTRAINHPTQPNPHLPKKTTQPISSPLKPLLCDITSHLHRAFTITPYNGNIYRQKT